VNLELRLVHESRDAIQELVPSPCHCKKSTHVFLFRIITSLLTLFVRQRLCIDFSVPVPANFLTTLHSHSLDVTCSCYFWYNLSMNVVYNCTSTVVVFHKKRQSLTVPPFSCFISFNITEKKNQYISRKLFHFRRILCNTRSSEDS